ncbi:MAG: DivIVA domain-containing protein [Candidatus Cloacimonetes bacterium]|nr:DivIVA domain-containing protein [Candidatus Cloacimonadota bacterium]
MKLTPLEIKNMVFPKKRLGGIDESSVREFLERVSDDYEIVLRDSARVAEELHLIKSDISDNSSLEKSLKEAVIVAKESSKIIKSNAEKQSLLMMKEAELKAERILDEARHELKTITNDIRKFKNLKRKLKGDLKVVLQSYSDILDED